MIDHFVGRLVEPLDEFFSKVNDSMNPEQALDGLVEDTVQAVVMDDIAWQCYQRRKPGRAEQLKRDFLARPELGGLAQDMWASMRSFIEQDAQSPNSRIRAHLAGMFVEVGRHLASDPQIRAYRTCSMIASSRCESSEPAWAKLKV